MKSAHRVVVQNKEVGGIIHLPDFHDGLFAFVHILPVAQQLLFDLAGGLVGDRHFVVTAGEDEAEDGGDGGGDGGGECTGDWRGQVYVSGWFDGVIVWVVRNCRVGRSRFLIPHNSIVDHSWNRCC